jgi:hypothetical protein
MTQTQTLGQAEVRVKRQKELERRREQKRRSEIAGIFFRYQEFEDRIRKEDEVRKMTGSGYLKFLEETVAAITEVRAEEKRRDDPIAWDKARNRVLTIGLLDQRSRQFGKSQDDVLSDIGRMANYSKWLWDIYKNGEEYLLPEIKPKIEFREPHVPAAEEFLKRPPRPRTLVLDLVDTSNQGAFDTRPDLIGRKKPRKNWRYERGLS